MSRTMDHAAIAGLLIDGEFSEEEIKRICLVMGIVITEEDWKEIRKARAYLRHEQGRLLFQLGVV